MKRTAKISQWLFISTNFKRKRMPKTHPSSVSHSKLQVGRWIFSPQTSSRIPAKHSLKSNTVNRVYRCTTAATVFRLLHSIVSTSGYTYCGHLLPISSTVF